MKDYSVVIIEDEIRNQKNLKRIIEDNCPDLKIVGMAESVKSGLEVIKNCKPDLVFLDIQLKDGTGFDILSKQEKINFGLIFTTAYDQYAIKAFKFSATDYLLKPISSTELVQAVERFKGEYEGNELTDYSSLLNNIKNSEDPLISISAIHKIDFVKVSNIIRIEGLGAYSNIFTAQGQKYTVSKVLKEYEDMLSDYPFTRVHQSHLINLKCVKQYIKRDQTIVLMDETEIPVSRQRKEEFMKKMEKMIIS